jgi:hypothetical protein
MTIPSQESCPHDQIVPGIGPKALNRDEGKELIQLEASETQAV